MKEEEQKKTQNVKAKKAKSIHAKPRFSVFNYFEQTLAHTIWFSLRALPFRSLTIPADLTYQVTINQMTKRRDARRLR